MITTVLRKLRDTAAKTMLFSFQVNIWIHGVSQDAIYKDDERMTKTQTLVDKLQVGYRTNSIINDLEKKGIS